jgi:hypothetical protein
MSGSVVFRWLLPAAVAALLAIPVQSAGASPMGGGHGMGGMGGGRGMGGMGGMHGMGGMGRSAFGGRGMMGGRPAMAPRFFSRNGMNFSHNGTNHVAEHHNLASSNHNVGRSSNRSSRSANPRDPSRDSHRLADRSADPRNQASNRWREGEGRHEGEEREEHEAFEGRHEGEEHEEHEAFERRDFFFRNHFFVGFDFAAFGLGWWWGPWWDWWYPWDYYSYYPYYGYSPCYDDPSGDTSSYGSQYGSQEGAQYWADLAKSVQSKLAEQSYYHGSIDGVIGSDTLQAIRQYQTDHGLAVTGKIDPKLLDDLGVEYKQQNERLNAG